MENYQFWSLFISLMSGFIYFTCVIFRLNHKINLKIDKLDDKYTNKIERIEDKIGALDSRLARVEGILQWLEKYFWGAEEK